MLERAWNAAGDDADSLLQTLQNFANADDSLADPSLRIQSSSSNGHFSSNTLPGQDTPTTSEVARGWTDLIERYRQAKSFLKACARYGLDAFDVKQCGQINDSLPALANNAQVVVDNGGAWAYLVDYYSLSGATADKVIGQPVSEEAVALWMLDNLVAVRQTRADYSDGIIGRVGGFA